MSIEELAVSRFYDSRLLSFYRDGRFRAAVKLSKVRTGDRVLDFGCYNQRLKLFLPYGVEYFGCDKNQEFSNVKNWKKLKDVDMVFAMAVLEHLSEKELDEIVKRFSLMGVETIVAEFPWEDNSVNRFFCWLFGLSFEHHLTHLSGWKAIANALGKSYECIEYRHLFWVTWVTVWKPKAKI